MKNRIIVPAIPVVRTGERGAALVMVLAMMMLVMLLVGSTVMLSRTSAMEATAAAEMGDSLYLAESAMARACWILMSDRQKHTDRNLGTIDYDNLLEPRFMADGISRELELNGDKVKVMALDMASGMDISGYNPDKQFYAYNEPLKTDPDGREELEKFRNLLLDYVDTDSVLRLNGMEEADYAAKDKPNLPRNRPMQYREEILWVPGADKMFPPDDYGLLGGARIIPPAGLGASFGKPNLFSASPATIRLFCNLTETELDKVTAALQKWRDQHTPLTDSLDPGLLAKVKDKMSLTESGYYTFILRAVPTDPNTPTRTLIVSLPITIVIPVDGLRFYQYQIF